MSLNFNKKGEFRFGKFNYEKAREAARNCVNFKLDNDEEEMSCGGERSCYDCAFRRWSAQSFICGFGQISARTSGAR